MRVAGDLEVLEEVERGDAVELEPGTKPQPVEHDPALGDEAPAPRASTKPKEAAEVKNLRAELAREKRRAEEAEQNAQFWSGRARGTGEEEEAAAPAAAAEEELPEIDLVEEITAKGVKGLEGVLKKLGYVKQKDVDAKLHGEITKTRKEVSRESALFGEFPDLRKPKSEFFKETAREYQELVREDPTLKKSPSTIAIAARLAESRLKKAKPARAGIDDEIPGMDDDEGVERDPEVIGRDDDRDEESEGERRRRVRSQQGDRGGGRSREDTASEELSPAQKKLIAQFRDAGANDLTEEGYKRRLRGGTVQIAGMRRH